MVACTSSSLIFWFGAAFLAVNGQAEDFDIPDDKIPRDSNGQKMIRFEPPKLTEEESHSSHMPSNLKCDGCMAVALKMSEKLQQLQRRFTSKRAPEAEIMDALEASCHGDNYESYGVKTVRGQTRLTGPGLYGEKEPGLMQGGGRWPVRLREMCGEFIGELDDGEIYNAFVSDGGLPGLRKLLCHGRGIFGTCRGIRPDDEL